MNHADVLRSKIQKIGDAGSMFDAANLVLKEMEDAIQGLNRRVSRNIDAYIDPDGEHVVTLSYHRGDIQGQRGQWGLFIKERIVDSLHDCATDTSWHWSNAPGVMRVKAASYRDQFLESATQVADSVISELPK